MKQNLFLLVTLILSIIHVGCSSDTEPEIIFPNETVSTSVELNCFKASSSTLSFESATDWNIEKNDSLWWFTVTPLSGKGGKKTLTLSATSNYEFTNTERSATISIVSGNITKKITVTQSPTYHLDNTKLEVEAGDTLLTFTFKTEAEKNEIKLYGDTLVSNKVIKGIVKLVETSNKQWSMTLKLHKNTSQRSRICYMQLAYNSLRSSIFTITQKAGATGESIDFSSDGMVTTLQKHTHGTGIPLVIMGDGFLDTDINSGIYDMTMNKAMTYFFNIEPTYSFRDYFDVYSVKAVSRYNTFTLNTDTTSTATAFGCTFGSGTLINGRDGKCQNYALKADKEMNLNNTLIIVVLNTPDYAGTCAMYYNDTKSDIPTGVSIAYVPMTDPDNYYGIGFEQVLHHEAIGHGFGKLDDEYYYENNGTIPEKEKQDLLVYQSYGICKNVDIHADVTQTLWNKLAADERYKGESLGVYEGAAYYPKGVYRPTSSSIMVGNTGMFNAPSREAIYKRVFYIANNGSYSYNYDDFTKYDAINRSTANSRSLLNTSLDNHLLPLSRPIFIPIKKKCRN